MSWGALSFLWLGLLGIPLVILYMRRVRQQPVTVPSLVFWDQALERTEATSFLRRLRRLLSLLLMLAILACLVLAAARPLFLRGANEPRLYIAILDASASMRAADGGESRFDLARGLAETMFAGLREPDRGALVLAGGAGAGLGELAVPPTSDREELLEALAAAAPATMGGDLQRALGVTREIVRAAVVGDHRPEEPTTSEGQTGDVPATPAATVVLFSDFAGSAAEWLDRDPDLGSGGAGRREMVRVPVGKATRNFHLRGVGARRNTLRSGDVLSFVVGGASLAAGAVEQGARTPLEVRILVDGAMARVLRLELAPGESEMREIDLDLPAGGLVRVELMAPGGGAADGFLLDNVGRAVLPPSDRTKVAILSPQGADGTAGAFFVSAAVQAMPDLIDLDGSVVATPGELSLEQLAEYDVIICEGGLPPEVPDLVGVLTAAPSEEGEGSWPAYVPARPIAPEAIEFPTIEHWDRDHPVNRFVSFEQLLVGKASPFNLTSTGTPLVETRRGILAAAYDQPRGRLIHVGFRFEETDSIFRVTFPIFLRNAMLWLSPRQKRLVPRVRRAGQPIRSLHSLPDAVSAVDVSRLEENGPAAGEGTGESTEPQLPVSGLQTTVTPQSGGFTFADTDEAGYYRFTAGDEVDFCAVNFQDPRESDLAPAAAHDPQAAREILPQPYRLPLWPWLAGLAFLLLLVEWILHGWRMTE